jgi:hypothetical protein
MATMLKLNNEEKLKIIDESLTHIKKVEANPDIECKDVDPYDAWFAFNERIDFNVHESNFGAQYDEDEPFEWHCSAYAVELNEDETFRINTDIMNYLFTYKEGKVEFKNE